MLPTSVLREVQTELLNWQGLGMSVLEIGHRTPEFQDLMDQARRDLRELLSVPPQYHILFLGGAARAQFAMIPMNLLSPGEQAGYLISGYWSDLAYQEAQLSSRAYCVASSEGTGFMSPPDPTAWQLRENTAYVYYTPNETINGVSYHDTPMVDYGIPLIADMTSCLLSEPVNVADFGLIFAGSQKNMGAAGLTIVIIRDDLLTKATVARLPSMQNYRVHAAHASLYATPPVFNCYLAAKVFQWIKKEGGVEALHQRNQEKAACLYQYLDQSDFYHAQVPVRARSIMNVCFSIGHQALEAEFVTRAAQKGLLALNGHRAVGGLRASLYNAMPMSGVLSLVDFMDEFAQSNSIIQRVSQ